MATRKKSEPKKRASGPTQPEDARKRKQCKIRLSDDELADVDEVAARWGVKRSEAVARLAREELERFG